MAATAEQKRVNDKGRVVLEKAKRLGSITALGKLQELLADESVDLADLGEVRQITINDKDWEALAKGEMKKEVDPVTGKTRAYRDKTRKEQMHARNTKIVLAPSWDTGPKWPVVQPARAVKATVPKRRGVPLIGLWRTLLFIPDEQIGFRRLASGVLEPFHDPRCIDIVLQVAEAERPDMIGHAGDLNDFAPFSKHRMEPGFAMTVQAGLDYAYEYLYLLSLLCGEQFVISGNHDIRLQNFIIDNASAAFGITRARMKSSPPEWPVLSLENLLHLPEINTEYVGAYPAGAKYINDNLAAIHGAKIGNKNRTAAQIVVEDERVSILHGHTHRRALAAKTRQGRGAAKDVIAYSPGTLARRDGAVPSTRGQIDAFGRHVTSFEDWQQGCAIVRYQEGNGRFALEDIAIFDGWAMHREQEFTSAREVNFAGAPGD